MAPYAGQYRTVNDLIDEALAKLGVKSAGQPTDPEDYNYVFSAYDGILRKLAGLEIITLSSYDTSSVPGAWFLDLASIIAGEVCQKFSYTGQDRTDMMNAGLGDGVTVEIGGGAAAKSLKQITRLKPTLEPLKADYFIWAALFIAASGMIS
jgi:hypothetical protein